jgi:hypothetical protein
MSTPAFAYQGAPVPNPYTFKQCPVSNRVAPTNSAVTVCIKGVASEGTIDIGGLDTTFKGPGVVQGGINLSESFGGTFNWSQALDGQSYSAPEQLLAKPVMAMLGNPSGVKPPAQSQVYVASAQAGPILFGVNAGLVTEIPLTFHLINPLLGNNCYVGTLSDPVVLNLTTGTSGALTGTLGTLAGAHNGNVLYTLGTEVVDNQFTVPGATHCGTGGVWDSVIDANNGLPSAAGANEAILYGNFDLAESRWVKHHLHE